MFIYLQCWEIDGRHIERPLNEKFGPVSIKQIILTTFKKIFFYHCSHSWWRVSLKELRFEDLKKSLSTWGSDHWRLQDFEFVIFLAETALAVALAVEDQHGCESFVLVHLRWHMFQTQGPSAGLNDRRVGVVVVRVRVSRHQAMSALYPVLGKFTSYSWVHLEVDMA